MTTLREELDEWRTGQVDEGEVLDAIESWAYGNEEKPGLVERVESVTGVWRNRWQEALRAELGEPHYEEET